MLTTHSVPHLYDEYGSRAMGYYDQRDLPYYYELAAQFATSDRWYSPVLANTLPNRMYLFTGTSFGNIFPVSPPAEGFDQRTIFDAVEDHGISWNYYYQDNSVFVDQFRGWRQRPSEHSRLANIEQYYTTLNRPTADQDLASVIFIERAGTTGLDEHPLNHVQQGAARVKQMIDALMRSNAWPTSVFIVTYDEGGGLYDHVGPAAMPTPDGIPPDRHEGDLPGDFNETGFRVPLIVVSPWVKPHFTSHTPKDFTAILNLIETRFNLQALTRRDGDPRQDMREFFDFSSPQMITPPPLPAQPTNGICDQRPETTP